MVRVLPLNIGYKSIPECQKVIDEGLQDPWGRPISTLVYLDSDHECDNVMCRLISGVLYVVGLMTISWTSNRQGNIK